MAEVAVVGAGIGGMAVAARLAKLGHGVTVLERTTAAGGSLHSVERDGFRWDAGVSSTSLPAVLRDLFRKSGRPVERYLDLEMSTTARRHLFADGTSVDLPTGSRADQIRALDAGLGPGAGSAWTAFVDAQADIWHRFRLGSGGPDAGYDEGAKRSESRLPVRRSVERLLADALPDVRLRQMAGHRFTVGGSKLRDVPAYAAMYVYVERSFGVWTCPNGLASLSSALVARLAERGVDLHYGAEVTRIRHAGHVTGVEIGRGSFIPADVVVAAIDPLTVFTELLHAGDTAAVKAFRAGTQVEPPGVTHLGLFGANPDGIAEELVLPTDPPTVIHTGGTAPAGHRAWTVRRRGDSTDDVLTIMARHGLDVRDEVVTHVDRSPAQMSAEAGGVSNTSAWDGWRAQRRRVRFDNPVPGLYVPAAALTPDASLPEVVWTAANVANRVGKP